MFRIKSKHSYVDLFEGILIGGSLAAMTTFLFGTHRGKKLQKEFMHKYKQLCHRAEKLRNKFEKVVKSSKVKTLKRVAKSLTSRKPLRKTKAKISKKRSAPKRTKGRAA